MTAYQILESNTHRWTEVADGVQPGSDLPLPEECLHEPADRLQGIRWHARLGMSSVPLYVNHLLIDV